MTLAGEHAHLFDIKFHIVLCHGQQLHTTLLDDEKQSFADMVIHISPHPPGMRKIGKTYNFCGPGEFDSESHHRLVLYEYMMRHATHNYSFVAFVDDDGFICLPRLVTSCRDFYPQSMFISGKMFCNAPWTKMNYFDQDYMLFSFDMMSRIAVSMKKIMHDRLKVLQTQGEAKFKKLQRHEWSFGQVHQRLVDSWIAGGEEVYVYDNREGIDSQQGTLNSMMFDGYAALETDIKRIAVAQEFWSVACAHGVWFHHVTRADVMNVTSKATALHKHMSPAPPAMDFITQKTCKWTTRRTFKHPDQSCVSSFGTHADEEWVQELCSHRYIFVRGQHHSGAAVLAQLLSFAKMDDTSAFSFDEEGVPQTPRVPDFEGQFLQEVWPWDDAYDHVELKACYCKCPVDASAWLCMFLCPAQAHLSRDTARDVYASWRQFWDTGSRMNSSDQPKVLVEASSGIEASPFLKFFPSVSHLIYVMRHPWASRFGFHHEACKIAPVSSEGVFPPSCLSDWIFLWHTVSTQQQTQVSVVRFEAFITSPETAIHHLLRVKLEGLYPSPTTHSMPADMLPQMSGALASHNSEVPRHLDKWTWHTTHSGKTTPLETPDVLGMAAECKASAACRSSCKEASAMQAAMTEFGYDLLEPEMSPFGADSPLLDLEQIFLKSHVTDMLPAQKASWLQNW
eukprot:CAMPEP_0178382650 /NCGR_PEP_ID=MMETSP0689_2-20121128/6600_1 /TAXON_ID=160604 /ORGANISM="Amphidinium massartii, Strain CS-259" /LENGTH=677 /DNA_ID=CAMNT_0020002855 /DNA_START=214 /DNA_END=2244 /DNA_ORIENTATION=-